MNSNLDIAVFDEKFQINTVLELDKETLLPLKEKLSKMTVCLDKSLGGKQIGEVEFNMADFNYGSYKAIRLQLNQCEGNADYNFDASETYIDIGLKGTKADGLVQKRMSAIKEYKKGSIEDWHFHKVATEITAIVAGKVRMNDKIYSNGDIIKINPSEGTDFECLEDTITVVVKVPGAMNDKYLK